jgi:hypothetical protein
MCSSRVLALAQRNRMNDQLILVDETGGNEALGESSASMSFIGGANGVSETVS